MIQIENDIISRCQQGDREAFRWVVQTHQRMIFSLALKMLCDEEEAKDMVQETFIRVWQSIRSFDSQSIRSFDSQRIATDIYSISGIPEIILFSPDGTILARGLRGKQIEIKLEEVFNNKK